MKRHMTLKGIALFMMGMFLAVLCFEVYCRIVEKTPLWKIAPLALAVPGRPDPVLGYRYIPNKEFIWLKENRARVHINDQGLRDEDLPLEKPPNTIRIALMGASYVEALQVAWEDTFDTLTEQLLNAAELGFNVEIINLGYSGAGPIRQFWYLKEIGLRYDPDIALFVTTVRKAEAATLGNDSVYPAYVQDREGNWSIGRSYRNRFSQRYLGHPVGETFLGLLEYSRSFALMYRKVKKKQLLQFKREALPNTANLKRGSLCEQISSKEGAFETLFSTKDSFEQSLVDHYFKELQDLLRQHEIQGIFGVLFLPDAGSHCEEIKERREIAVQELQQGFQKYNLDWIDLEREVLQRVSQSELWKLSGFGLQLGNGHFNEQGHQVYAEVLVDRLIPILKK